jgi:UDP-glucose:(glucosyl)LPS alpha-1,2-glucosyltransferase
MSAVIKGHVFDTALTVNSKGGTELMRNRLLKSIPSSMLERVAIHFSRVRDDNIQSDVPNIFYAHDLETDPESAFLATKSDKFAAFVFVSKWQRDRYVHRFDLQSSKCFVIENCIEADLSERPERNDDDPIRLIYHTTPHRGLELLYPAFLQLVQRYGRKVELDVFSSFSIYGWPQRDKRYEQLFERLRQHPQIRYHGARPNDEVLTALQKADIFLYPCIWLETSCLALIEAMKAGCVCIHSDYGALKETGSGVTLTFPFDSEPALHIQYAVDKTVYAIENGFRASSVALQHPDLIRFNRSSYATKWVSVLDRVLHPN